MNNKIYVLYPLLQYFSIVKSSLGYENVKKVILNGLTNICELCTKHLFLRLRYRGRNILEFFFKSIRFAIIVWSHIYRFAVYQSSMRQLYKQNSMRNGQEFEGNL